MKLFTLRRRTAPAAPIAQHDSRLAWRLGALALDYPNARADRPIASGPGDATASSLQAGVTP
ncbi:hypothetical protein [Nocardia sp. NPDC057668]|uniref:hypothetical protein n=1 Tax=Nocardia sp. NPDC057668 TaxID=3346202 RepID=UPI0036705BD0